MSVNKLLLDTNSYFRLAENIKPLLGCEFGKGDKVKLYILTGTISEFNKEPRLMHKFDWLDNKYHREERKKGILRIGEAERPGIKRVCEFLLDASRDLELGCSDFDVYCAAVSRQLRIPLVSDDRDLKSLAKEFGIKVYSTMQLMKQLFDVGVVTSKVVEDIIYMWKYLDDLPDNFHSEYKHYFPV